MDIFGIKAKREAKRAAAEKERLEKAQEKKRIYQERKSLIESYLKDYNSNLNEIEARNYEKKKELAEKSNTTCPKCGSKNVINTIKRTKGEVHGESTYSSSGSFSSFLFGHSSSFSSNGHSKVDGELDTYPINKCNDCGNEWNITEAKWASVSGKFTKYDSYEPRLLYRRIEEYLNLEYDSYDVTDKFNSLEEKQENFLKENCTTIRMNYSNVPRYMVDYALYIGMKYSSFSNYSDDIDKRFGDIENTDEFSYVMPDEIWEITKKLLKWEDPEIKNAKKQ